MVADPEQSDDSGEFYCYRDSCAVSPDRLRCKHPSSQCEYRVLCEVVAAERKRRKQETEQES